MGRESCCDEAGPLLSQPLWAPFSQPSIHSLIAYLRSTYYIHAVLLVLELRPREKETPHLCACGVDIQQPI